MNCVCTVKNAAENASGKSRYHTGLLIAYRLDVLEEDTLSSIPSSTLCDWRKRDITGIVGFDPDDPWLRELDVIGKFHSRRFLKRVVIALVRVSDFHAALVDGIRGRKRIFRERRERIVALISRIAPVLRLDRACRLMRITVQRYYRVLTLMCDGGSENAGAVDDFLARPDVLIEKRIAFVDVHSRTCTQCHTITKNL